ncbi:MAG TPA: hypothetical protein VK003_10980 [Oceanobacillus sp.]|nr:hypothetical protein [Oceanobacillus sp.]
MKQLILAIAMMLALTTSASAQDNWQVTDSLDARELFEGFVFALALSPDGTLVAAGTRDEICLAQVATAEVTCYPLPDAFGGGILPRPGFNPLVWSPDSTSIALTEDFYAFSYESDLWVLDTQSGTYTNRTDDGVEEFSITSDEKIAAMVLDHLPAYAPDGDLYFFRTQRVGGVWTTTLHHLAADGGDTPELIADLTDILPSLSVFYSPVVSPDGTQIAFPVRANDYDDVRTGLWLVDLATGEARQLTDGTDNVAGMPKALQSDAFYALNPVWLPDGSGIVFETLSLDMTYALPEHNYLYVEVASGEVTPLIDLSDFPVPEDGDSEDEIRILRDGALSADGTVFAYLHYEDTPTIDAQITLIQLPPGETAPIVITGVEHIPSPTAAPNPMMSADGKALLGGWLYTLGQP